ncbi:MAG TPA: DUF4249 domain-containing protein [Flavisolibacter sp.]|jgi:hypothetical protein|nr:DUF4249 domain-containing protein [Flavisolibacter sp.]
MKLHLPIIILVFAALFFTSCEKVIDVNVRDADKKLVIEGVLTDQSGDCLVKISRTKSLSSTNEMDAVSGASVQIRDGNGAVVQLIETAAGQYRADLIGQPGTTYELTVKLGGQTYTAVSSMPTSIAIDSLYVSEMDMMGEKQYVTNVVFTDPTEAGNAYRFVQYRNEVKNKMFMVQKDDLTNGRKNTVSFFHHMDELKKGDRIRVQLQSIDPAVYTYWYSLWQGGTGEGNSASPANPVSNIRGGSLGYFSAQAVTSKETAVL